ncbi:hypothetical protein LBGG_02267 [Lactobacillus gasseri MV-22]|nr:hypothetical protein LBGG_02267 [Lactobacillus gasseri MV-22]
MNAGLIADSVIVVLSVAVTIIFMFIQKIRLLLIRKLCKAMH